MAVYVTQRKESFSREIHLEIKKTFLRGVTILTNHPLCNEVFNYSGIHSLFDAVATITLLRKSQFFLATGSMLPQCGAPTWATGRLRGGGTLDDEPVRVNYHVRVPPRA